MAERRSDAMQIRDVLTVLVAAILIGLVLFSTLKLEWTTPQSTVEQAK